MRSVRPILRREAGGPPLRSLALRAGAVLGLFLLAIGGHWFERDGLKDNVDGEVSFLDALYFTAITVTTVGYGDIVPVSDRARLFDTFVVTPIRLFIWLIFVGTAYSFVLKNRLDQWRSARIGRMLNGHTIVCGYGATGREAVDELRRRGHAPADILVIDPDEASVAAAAETGVVTLCGDPSRNAVLEAAAVRRARAVVVAPGRDDTAVLIVLTAHSLAPEAVITVEIAERDNEVLARGAGADTVVNPVSFGGQLLALSTEGEHVREYLCDLVTGEGRVAMRERPVELGEVGRPLSALGTGMGLRVYRDGRPIGFWEPEASALREGDSVIEIVPVGG